MTMIATPTPISVNTFGNNFTVASPSSRQARIPLITYVAGETAAIFCSQPGSVSMG